jgi:hypothetical protein
MVILRPGTILDFRSKYARPRLYALQGDLPADGAAEIESILARDPPRTAGSLPVHDIVATSSPVDGFHTVWEFQGIDGKRIALRHVRTTCYDAHGREVAVLGGTGFVGRLAATGLLWPPMLLCLVGLAGLLVMDRRRRPPVAERSEP